MQQCERIRAVATGIIYGHRIVDGQNLASTHLMADSVMAAVRPGTGGMLIRAGDDGHVVLWDEAFLQNGTTELPKVQPCLVLSRQHIDHVLEYDDLVIDHGSVPEGSSVRLFKGEDNGTCQCGACHPKNARDTVADLLEQFEESQSRLLSSIRAALAELI